MITLSLKMMIMLIINRHIMMVCNKHYYSFKIFVRFCLAKIARIFNHNQLPSTKLGRI